MQCPTCHLELDASETCTRCAGAGLVAVVRDEAGGQPAPPVRPSVEGAGELAETRDPDAPGSNPTSPVGNASTEVDPKPSPPSEPAVGGGSGAQAEPPPASVPREAPRATGPDAGAETPEKREPGEGFKFDQSRFGSMLVSTGDNATYNTFVRMGRDAEKAFGRKIWPVLELTSELSVPEPGGAEFAENEVEAWVSRLRGRRLLFISCVDARVGLAAAHAVVGRVGSVPPARLLSFDRVPAEEAPQTVYDVVRPAAERTAELVVVVDAVSRRSHAFLDHLLDSGTGLLSADSLRQHLTETRILTVCMVPAARLTAPVVRDLSFPYWAVPFLEHLLAAACPAEHGELREELGRQRARGRWSRDESVFCSQIRAALATDSLRAVVAAGGPSFDGEVAQYAEHPVHSVVLYAGAFFHGLNPADFGRLVTVLLGDETMEIPPEPPGGSPPAEDGAAAPAPPREKRLAAVWAERGDRILRECRLAALKEGEGARFIGFANPSEGDALRQHFEDEFAITVHTRFAAVHAAGLLFDRSDPIAANVVRLTTDMAAEHPETYGRDWLIRGFVEALANVLDWSPVFGRFAELLRGFSAREELQPVVAGVIERLLFTRQFGAALALVKRLRFAPGFDQFHWLKQLLERGGESEREAVEHILYRDIMAMGPEVHPILHAIARWLPGEGDDPDRYSRAGRLALRLWVEYAVDTAARLPQEDYGAWPSRYPLLALSSAEAAERELPLMVRWLVHPGIPVACAEEDEAPVHSELAAVLLAEWVCILFGPAACPADTADAVGDAGVPAAPRDFGPDAVLDLLVAELARQTAEMPGRKLRDAMLRDWEMLKDVIMRQMSALPPNAVAVRAELAWRRKLLRVLVLRVRAQRASAARALSSATP